MSEFTSMYNLKNVIKQKTCFKSPENPSCTDLVLPICPRSFSKGIIYRNYQNFQIDNFRGKLDNEILKCHLNNMEYQYFLNLFREVSTKHAPLKKTS